MSNLDKTLQQDLNESLKKGDHDSINALRFLISRIQYARIEKQDDLTDQDIIAVIAKQAKSRRESIEAFEAGGRDDLVEKETRDLAVIERYLPEMLGEHAVRDVIRRIILQEECSGIADMGKLMKGVMAELKGKADGKLVSRLASEELQRDTD
ncbi:GatB/YqeY domain-containing protein [Candidatus Zixiibacteriota bacterium]